MEDADIQTASGANLPLGLTRYLTIKLRPEGNVYIATAEQLPGCVSQGKTLIDAIANIGEAITAWARVKIRFDGIDPAEPAQPPALAWAKLSAPDKPEMVGVRDLQDGWGEALMHNEGLTYPFYTALLPPDELANLLRQTNEHVGLLTARLNETTY